MAKEACGMSIENYALRKWGKKEGEAGGAHQYPGLCNDFESSGPPATVQVVKSKNKEKKLEVFHRQLSTQRCRRCRCCYDDGVLYRPPHSGAISRPPSFLSLFIGLSYLIGSPSFAPFHISLWPMHLSAVYPSSPRYLTIAYLPLLQSLCRNYTSLFSTENHKHVRDWIIFCFDKYRWERGFQKAWSQFHETMTRA